MIFLFRKEIKKWNVIWWFVLASLVFGLVGGSFLFRKSDRVAVSVATVNGQSVSLKEYRHVYGELKASLDDLAIYWGIPVDRLAKFMGIESLPQASVDRCIQDVLMDNVASSFSIHLDQQSFQDALSASLSKNFIDQSGKLNLPAYQNYLSRLHMSISDYENSKEREFKRSSVLKCVEQSIYVPHYLRDAITQGQLKKFAIMTLPLDAFLATAKQGPAVSDADLKEFYRAKQELYRVEEKRKAKYWILTPEDYKKKVDVDAELIEKYYEKNKSTLYRIPPKVKIRSIVFNIAPHASPEMVSSIRKQAETVLADVKQAPEKFVEFVKKYSQDKGKNDGLSDFFQRGTFDPEIEQVAFLKLKQSGDISDLITTKRGLEIIKLEDRIAAAEKPLSLVKDEITKSLIDKKAIMTLRGDLETLMRVSRTDETVCEKFADSNKLATYATDWLIKDMHFGVNDTRVNDTRVKDTHVKDTSVKDKNDLMELLVQKMFSDRKKLLGYFVHQGQHVLYKVSERQESFIPAFEKVVDRVRADWYAQKAEALQKKAVNDLRKTLLTKKCSLDEIKGGFGVMVTPLVKAGDEVKELKNLGNLLSEAFLLSDRTQVFTYKHDANYYLVKLLETKIDASATGKEKEAVALDQEKKFKKQRYLDAFIASLQRNATIKINLGMLKDEA